MTTICIFCAKHTKLNVIRNGMTRLCKMKKKYMRLPCFVCSYSSCREIRILSLASIISYLTFH